MTAREWLSAQADQLTHLDRFDLEHLLCDRLGVTRAHLLAYLDETLPRDILPRLAQDAERLRRREPFQYVLGKAWFGDAQFEVDRRVLIPRFDTEFLVETVLDRCGDACERVLDLCTGSGIVAVSLARAKSWQVFASDISAQALQVAQSNAARLAPGVSFRQGDLLAPWQGMHFDCICANPPYVSRSEYETLAPEVHQEPELALVADHDGLFFYERLADQAPAYLNRPGLMAVEIGWQQGQAVAALFEQAGFRDIEIRKDGQALDRVVSGRLF